MSRGQTVQPSEKEKLGDTFEANRTVWGHAPPENFEYLENANSSVLWKQFLSKAFGKLIAFFIVTGYKDVNDKYNPVMNKPTSAQIHVDKIWKILLTTSVLQFL